MAIPGIYRDNAFVRTAWRGNDAITLLVAVPLLAAAVFYSGRGRVRWRLLWLGLLDYMLYNYAFYLFAASFNSLFLVYAALFGLAMFALIFGLARLDALTVSRGIRGGARFRWIAGYLLFVGIGLALVYVMQSVAFIATGELPAIVVRSEHPSSIVFALDLILLVPWLVLGGIWLLRRRPWGYDIAGVVSAKASLYTLVLTVNTWLVMRAGLGGEEELPLWAALTVLGLIVCGLLLASVRESDGVLPGARRQRSPLPLVD